MNKCAIVTGGSRGIGRGIVLELARNGYDIATSYRSMLQEAESLQREVERNGHKCYIFQADFTQREAGIHFFQDAVNALGNLDLMVNNAGITIFESILDLSDDAFDRMMDLDFRNYYVLMRESSRYFVENGIRGSIVNITSSRGERAYPGDCIYGALKAGLNRGIQSIALDLAPYGIRVNNVAPGAIRVRTAEEMKTDPEYADMDTTFWDELGERIPLQRAGVPEDVAKAVVFLASEAASYITGTTLRVDGGLILPGMVEEQLEDDLGWGWMKPKTIEQKTE